VSWPKGASARKSPESIDLRARNEDADHRWDEGVPTSCSFGEAPFFGRSFTTTTLALLAIALGAVQLLRRKGDGAHRAIGYAYVYSLLVADGAAMLVFQFTGALNILHFGVIANLICISIGMLSRVQQA
jgi:hypothetical protein